MLKRFSTSNNFFKSSISTTINQRLKFGFNKNSKLFFSTANAGVKTIDLIKILRAETSKKIKNNFT